MTCADDDAALELLASVGYYRLSAYTYPLRALLPPGAVAGSSVEFRADNFAAGATIESVRNLYMFDRKLRNLCLAGLEIVEVGVRARLAYLLGGYETEAHTNRSLLDATACSKPSKRAGVDRYDAWLSRFNVQVRDSKEDYVTHHREKYGGRIPIWVAVEIMDFGSVVRLFSFLTKRDQTAIAAPLGIKQGPQFHKHLLALNYLRNLCAHHARVWNRRMTFEVAAVNPASVAPDLAHLASVTQRRKAYIYLAVLAHLVHILDPDTRWPSSVRTHVIEFPAISGLSPELSMGFPSGWQSEPLWRHTR